MTNYQGRIREIQSAFVMGYQDRETCIRMFEELLHDYNLLPKEEQLDRTITNERFLALLKTAKDHTDRSPRPANPEAGIAKIGESAVRYCPVCQKPTQALFNRVQSLDQQTIPVEPPRCQECMTKWVREKFGAAPGDSFVDRSKAEPTFTVDRTPASPMKPDEADFFAEYEKQMEEADD